MVFCVDFERWALTSKEILVTKGKGCHGDARRFMLIKKFSGVVLAKNRKN